jgi:hypothetical protein
MPIGSPAARWKQWWHEANGITVASRPLGSQPFPLSAPTSPPIEVWLKLFYPVDTVNDRIEQSAAGVTEAG